MEEGLIHEDPIPKLEQREAIPTMTTSARGK